MEIERLRTKADKLLADLGYKGPILVGNKYKFFYFSSPGTRIEFDTRTMSARKHGPVGGPCDGFMTADELEAAMAKLADLEEIQTAERLVLQPCPFCGCEMDVVATTTGSCQGYSADGEHAEGCPLEDDIVAFRLKPCECADCWNMRV